MWERRPQAQPRGAQRPRGGISPDCVIHLPLFLCFFACSGCMEEIKRLHWTAYTAINRHEAIQVVQRLVQSPAFVTDFHFFSDLSASLQIEVPGSHCAALLESLQSVMTVETREPVAALTQASLLVLLQLNFSGGSGMLRHTIPEVPG